MRTSTLAILAIAAVAAPVFAAPAQSSRLRPVSSLALESLNREDMQMMARDSFGQDFLKGFELPSEALGNILRREPEAFELAARDSFGEDFLKGFELPFQALGKVLRRESELDARDSFGQDFVKGFELPFEALSKILRRSPESEELLARSTLSDFASGFESGFTGTLKTLGPIALGLLRREDLEMLARSYPEMNVVRGLSDLD